MIDETLLHRQKIWDTKLETCCSIHVKPKFLIFFSIYNSFNLKWKGLNSYTVKIRVCSLFITRFLYLIVETPKYGPMWLHDKMKRKDMFFKLFITNMRLLIITFYCKTQKCEKNTKLNNINQFSAKLKIDPKNVSRCLVSQKRYFVR